MAVKRFIALAIGKLRFGRSVLIAPGVKVASSKLAKNTKIYEGAELLSSTIGRGTYVGRRSRLVMAEVGRFCSIGPDVLIGLGRHPINQFASTHPAFFSAEKQAGFTFVESNKFTEHLPCKIGNDVWIGARAMVMDGVEVADGAIIAAGAVVTRNVAPYTIVAGVPARVLKSRFDDVTLRAIHTSKWWLQDDEVLAKLARTEDVTDFISQAADFT